MAFMNDKKWFHDNAINFTQNLTLTIILDDIISLLTPSRQLKQKNKCSCASSHNIWVIFGAWDFEDKLKSLLKLSTYVNF